MSIRNKILIIEDEPDVLTYLEILFQDNGYDTIGAYDGVTGLKIAQSEKPDLITLDITMPGQSGIAAYCQYKKDSNIHNIPVVIITATADSISSYHERLQNFPSPEGFVTKPINPEELLKKISSIFSAQH